MDSLSYKSAATAMQKSRRGLPLWLMTLTTLILVGGWLGWNTYGDYQSMMEREYTLLEVGAYNRAAHIKGLVRSAEVMMLNIESDLLDEPRQTPPHIERFFEAPGTPAAGNARPGTHRPCGCPHRVIPWDGHWFRCLEA